MADLVSEDEVPFNARGVVDQMVCSVAARCPLACFCASVLTEHASAATATISSRVCEHSVAVFLVFGFARKLLMPRDKLQHNTMTRVQAES